MQTVVAWIYEHQPSVEDFLTWDVSGIDLADAWEYMPSPHQLTLRPFGSDAGPFAVYGGITPNRWRSFIGFRATWRHFGVLSTWAGFCDVVRRLAVWRVLGGTKRKGHG